MKKLLLAAATLLTLNTAFAQLNKPVQWDFSAKRIDDRTFEVHAMAFIEHPWHIYSQTSGGNGSLGLPTTFTFKPNPILEFVGKPKEIGKLKEENVDGTILKYFPGQVDFVQVVKIKDGIKATTTVMGEIVFMACNDGQCLPEDNTRFNVPLK